MANTEWKYCQLEQQYSGRLPINASPVKPNESGQSIDYQLLAKMFDTDNQYLLATGRIQTVGESYSEIADGWHSIQRSQKEPIIGTRIIKIHGHWRPVSRILRTFIAIPGQIDAMANSEYSAEGVNFHRSVPRTRLTRKIFQKSIRFVRPSKSKAFVQNWG